MTDQSLRELVPAYVKDEQIFDFDHFMDRRFEVDLQKGYSSLHAEAPDIFYTPRNGGFWVVTRYDLMEQVLRDTEHFSNRELDIPKSNSPYVMIPLNLDPPDHLPFRMALMRHFDPKTIRAMEPKLRAWANRLIDAVIDKGECEFAEGVGAAFPVSVFMELMGLPLDRFEEFRVIVLEYFGHTTLERRIALQEHMMKVMWDEFEKRKTDPRDDLMTKLVNEKVKGRPLSDDELQSIGFLLFIAGLDTVANTLGFTFRQLALHPDLQDRLVADPDCTQNFVEEALRRCSIVQQTRIVKKDFELAGAHFHEGDMVSCPLMLGGMDDRKNNDPDKIDIDRANRNHLAFSTGPHICIGNFLARMEMRIMVQEWTRRIPRFWIKPGTQAKWRAGGVAALSDLYLQWDKPQG
ncbi:cytochrome P450 [Sphingobium aromaticiconvertens]|uniref:cytochrome P450 n=1 Tax=Sphingobium aromaticiconvertens TaxID=365341 RepID=UPI00301B63D1